VRANSFGLKPSALVGLPGPDRDAARLRVCGVFAFAASQQRRSRSVQHIVGGLGGPPRGTAGWVPDNGWPSGPPRPLSRAIWRPGRSISGRPARSCTRRWSATGSQLHTANLVGTRGIAESTRPGVVQGGVIDARPRVIPRASLLGACSRAAGGWWLGRSGVRVYVACSTRSIWRITTTGHGACAATCSLTEPNNMPAAAVRPAPQRCHCQNFRRRKTVTVVF